MNRIPFSARLNNLTIKRINEMNTARYSKGRIVDRAIHILYGFYKGYPINEVLNAVGIYIDEIKGESK